ncbi:hypothetical protein ACOME3_009651 [Neoechinorhynchus agilis]
MNSQGGTKALDDQIFHAFIADTLRKAYEESCDKLMQLDSAVKSGYFSQSKQLFECQLRSTRFSTYLGYLLSIRTEFDAYLRIVKGAQSLLNAHLANGSANSILERVKRQCRLNGQILNNLGTQFESSLGIIRIDFKELVAFTRICPLDEYLITASYCKQRFCCRCKINSDGTQCWTHNMMLMQSNGFHQEMRLKVHETRHLGKRRNKLGVIALDRTQLFQQLNELQMLCEVNECGTIKLRICLRWIPPFDSAELWRLQEHIFNSRSFDLQQLPFIMKLNDQDQHKLGGTNDVQATLNRSISLRSNVMAFRNDATSENQSLPKNCRFTSFHMSKLCPALSTNRQQRSKKHFTTMSTIIPTSSAFCPPIHNTSRSSSNSSSTHELTDQSVVDCVAGTQSSPCHGKTDAFNVSIYLPAIDGILSEPSASLALRKQVVSVATGCVENRKEVVSYSEQSTNNFRTKKVHEKPPNSSEVQKVKGCFESQSTPNLMFIASKMTSVVSAIDGQKSDILFNEADLMIDDCFSFLDSDYGTNETDGKGEIRRSDIGDISLFNRLTTWPATLRAGNSHKVTTQSNISVERITSRRT